jgi:nucleoside-diphosphate-sugar epimerase
MRVLVTGAGGHIGTFVIRELASAGHELILTDRVPFDAPATAQVFVGDLRDAELVRKAVADAQAVVHLGAIPHPNTDDPSTLFATNCLTAHRVLDEAGRAGVHRIVAASSLAAVGLAWSPIPVAPQYLPLDEEHPLLVSDPYGLSKVVLEETARSTRLRWGTDIVCLRLPFTGTGHRLALQLADVAADPGAHRRDLWSWLDTRDAAAVIRRAVEADITGCHVLNVAAPDTSCLLRTSELLRQHLPGVPVFAHLPGRTSLIDTKACADLLDFVPRHSRPSGQGE